MTDGVVKDELRRRMAMWEALQASGGSSGVAKSRVRELGIYGGAQGIWVDKERTEAVTPQGTGATVGLLHTGRTYADDLSVDGVLYHYPVTERPASRDRNEILATKVTRELGLPVFVIAGEPLRDVHLAWVERWDDEAKVFLVTFGDSPPRRAMRNLDAPASFELLENRARAKVSVTARTGQSRFKFETLKGYGPRCAVCDQDALAVLDAAHLCPYESGGTDDPRNGLILCATHHRALDAGLFAIEPGSLKLRFTTGGPNAQDLRITRPSIAHLRKQPHVEALTWLWRRWTP